MIVADFLLLTPHRGAEAAERSSCRRLSSFRSLNLGAISELVLYPWLQVKLQVLGTVLPRLS